MTHLKRFEHMSVTDATIVVTFSAFSAVISLSQGLPLILLLGVVVVQQHT